MMNGFNEGMSAGGWLLMSVFWVALIAVVVWAVATLLAQTRGEEPAQRHTVERPDAILDRRLASGEIDESTYDSLRLKLGEARSARR